MLSDSQNMTPEEAHKERFESFVADLNALCIRHNVHLAVGCDEMISVYNLSEGDPPIWDHHEINNKLNLNSAEV